MPGVTPAARHTALIGSDLKTGKQKLRWNLPGANSTCNDFSLGPDKAHYKRPLTSGWMRRSRDADGMRAVNGKLLLAETGAGKVDALTIQGDTAHVTVLRQGLNTPTAVEPAGKTIWIAERGAGKADSVPMPVAVRPKKGTFLEAEAIWLRPC